MILLSHRIQIFDSNGNFLRKFGYGGSGDGQFSYLSGVAINFKGLHHEIIVADNNNHRIQIFDSEGNFLKKIEGIYHPYGVAINSRGNLIVCEAIRLKNVYIIHISIIYI